MRYGTIPRGLKERLATALGVVPYPMLDVLVAPLQARALIAAERACLDLVLRLLASMGYVKRRGGLWSLTRLGGKHFGSGASESFRDFVAFGAPQWEWISELDRILKTGQGVEIHRSLSGEDWPLYQRAMAIHVRALGPNHPEVSEQLNALGLIAKKVRQESLAGYGWRTIRHALRGESGQPALVPDK